MRILLMDLETAPHLVYTWQTYKAFINPNQVVEPARIICFTAKWLGEGDVEFYSEFHDGRDGMLLKLWEMFDEADVIVTYNGKKFDEPWVMSELLLEGFTPPSPWRSIDLYQTVRSVSKFPSNRLAYVAPTLVSDTKVTNSGFELWLGCLAEDPESWEQMKTYAIQDTALLEPLYIKLRPWIKNIPNVGLYDGDDFCCPACGSGNIQYRGYTYTGASKYRRVRCKDCGKWSRTAQRVETTGLRNV